MQSLRPSLGSLPLLSLSEELFQSAMDFLRVDVCFQKSPQESSRSRSFGGPLARLGVDSRREVLKRLVRPADFPELVGDLSQQLLGGAAPIVLDIGQMSGGDIEIRRESAQGESRMQPEPANLLAEVGWGQGARP